MPVQSQHARDYPAGFCDAAGQPWPADRVDAASRAPRPGAGASRVELPSIRDPFQSMDPAILEEDARTGAEVFDGARHDNLARCRDGADARRDVDGDASDVIAVHFDLPGVNAGANLETERVQVPDDVLGAAHRARWSVKRDQEGIAEGFDLAAAVSPKLSPDRAVVARKQSLPVFIAEFCRLRGRADDVAEEHGGEHTIGLGRVAGTSEEFLDFPHQRLAVAYPRQVIVTRQRHKARAADVVSEVAAILRVDHAIARPMQDKGRNVDTR